jgi:predicted phosphodiesterase
MKTVIFSDTHLSNRTYRKKFTYLKSIIEPADRVIILGDFWDGFLTSFDKFVTSRWSALFPMLLEREAFYVYGNHDRQQWCDERVNLFSAAQGTHTTLRAGDRSLYLTHGHSVFTSLEDQFPVLNHSLPLRIGANIDVLHKLVWGRRFLRQDRNANDTARRWVTEHLPGGEILICGHRHYPEIDLYSRMVNTGFIGVGYGNYVLIDDEKISLIRERY